MSDKGPEVATAFDVEVEICETCHHLGVTINDEVTLGGGQHDDACTGGVVAVHMGTYCPSKDDERHRDCAEMDDIVLQVLCRVFDDGADEGVEEWRKFYGDGSGWFWWGRAFGAFIWGRLKDKAGNVELGTLDAAARHFESIGHGPGGEDFRKYAGAIRTAAATLQASGIATSPPADGPAPRSE